jgi:hypothetical protein
MSKKTIQKEEEEEEEEVEDIELKSNIIEEEEEEEEKEKEEEEEKKPTFEKLKINGIKKQSRSIRVPTSRIKVLQKSWESIYTPIVEKLECNFLTIK